MADEQVIGVAQLRLEADVADFSEGLRQAIEEVDKGGDALAKFAEKGEKEGARLIAAEQKVGSEIAALTETATQRQIRAVDERTARVIASARHRGVSEEQIAQLEIAAYRRKHAILMAEEKRTAVVVTRAGDESRGSMEKTRTAVFHLGREFGGASTGVGKIVNALSDLAMAASGPGLAIGGAAAAIGVLMRKHEAAAKATEEHAKRAKEWALTIRKLNAEIHDIKTGEDTAKWVDQKDAVERASAAVAKWSDLHILATKGVAELTDAEAKRLAAAGRAEGFFSDYMVREGVARERLKEALEVQRQAISEINLTRQRDKAAELDREAEHQHVKKIERAAKESEAISKSADDEYAMQARADEKEEEAIQKRAREDEAAWRGVQKMSEAIQEDEERAAELAERAEEHAAAAAEAADAYAEIEDSATATAEAVAAAAAGQRDAAFPEHPFFGTHIIADDAAQASMLRRRFTGDQVVTRAEWEAMREDAMRQFPGQFGLPATGAPGSGGASVAVNVYNSAGELVGVDPAVSSGPDGTIIDIQVSQAILGGSRTRDAIADALGRGMTGVGR